MLADLDLLLIAVFCTADDLLPKKPGILPLEETMTKQCRRCGAAFITRSRIRKRCDVCQTLVSAEKQKKANERLKARRAARRLCLIPN